MQQEKVSIVETLGTASNVILLVFNELYDVKNARLLVRAGYESRRNAGTVYTTTFQKETRIVRLPGLRRYAIPVKLNTGYKTTIVEVVDTTTDISCVFAIRHGELVNPYGMKSTKEVVMEVTVPISEDCAVEQAHDDQVLNFLSSVIKLADITGGDGENLQLEPDGDVVCVARETQREVCVDPILELETHYRSCQPVFVENRQATMITGTYWWNESHWRACNNELLTAPLSSSLYPVDAAWSMPMLLRQLHMCFVKPMERNVKYDYVMPQNVKDRASFPQLFEVDANTLISLYTGVARDVMLALSQIYRDIPFPPSHVNFTDFKDSSILITRADLYRTNGLDVLRNPFNPWTNGFFCRRWGLEEYTNYRSHLGQTLHEVPGSKSSWCVFTIRDALIESVKHATGQTYGDIDYDNRPLQTLRIQLMQLCEAAWNGSELSETTAKTVQTCIDGMILRGLGRHPAIICYANVDDGRMYVTHPLFPPGKCVAFYPPLVSGAEIELLVSEVRRATESLYRHSITKP